MVPKAFWALPVFVGFCILGALAGVIGIVFVAIHFIHKWW